MHGDMQSGAWNPVVWMFSAFTTYDLTVFHIETLFYIFFSGISMFGLAGLFTQERNSRLFAAIAYMLCGYMMGSGQFINWIASAAIIPFVLHAYYRFLTSGKTEHAILTGICCWLLFVCGYPADLIYVFYILLAMLLTAVFQGREKLRRSIGLFKRYTINHVLMVILFFGLAAPAIISYLDLLPYYTRGAGITLAQAKENSFELKNFISLINPLPISANHFQSETDPTGRNLYVGIVTLCLFLYSLFFRQGLLSRFLIGLFIFSILFSIGDSFLIREFSFYVLPGMNAFRHPSHFRLFAIIPMILLAVVGVNKMTVPERPTIFKWICICLIILTCFTIVFSFASGSSGNFSNLLPQQFNGRSIKQWLNSLNTSRLYFIGGCLQLLFLLFLLLIYKLKSDFLKAAALLNFFNLLVFQSLFPVHFVSKTSPSEINTLIHNAPTSFDKEQINKNLLDNSKDAFEHYDQVGLYYFYNKRIGISRITNSPSFLSSQMRFVEDPFLYSYISHQPFIYFSDSLVLRADTNNIINDRLCYTFVENKEPGLLSNPCGRATAQITNILVRYNEIEVQVKSTDSIMLNLIQNYHHNWQVEVDHQPQKVYRANESFMTIPIQGGTHSVKWKFSPRNTIIGLWIALGAFLFVVFLLIFRTKSR